jgi:hypothetical protein
MIKYLTKPSSEFMWSSMIRNSCSTTGTKRVNLVTNPVISHKREKERIWKYTWSSAIHIFCSDNQVIVAVVELLKRRLQLNQYELLVHESPYSSNHLSRKSLWKSQALEYRINWEISTPYTSAARMLLRINGKSTMRKWNDLVSFVLNMTDNQKLLWAIVCWMKQSVGIYQMLRDAIMLFLQFSTIHVLHFYLWQKMLYTDNILINHLHHKSSSFIIYEAIFRILRMIDHFTYDKKM